MVTSGYANASSWQLSSISLFGLRCKPNSLALADLAGASAVIASSHLTPEQFTDTTVSLSGVSVTSGFRLRWDCGAPPAPSSAGVRWQVVVGVSVGVAVLLAFVLVVVRRRRNVVEVDGISEPLSSEEEEEEEEEELGRRDSSAHTQTLPNDYANL